MAPVTAEAAKQALKKRVKGWKLESSAPETVVEDLQIGASWSVSDTILAALRAEFCPRHLNVRVFTTPGADTEIRDLLLQGRIELAIFSDSKWVDGFLLQPFLAPGSPLPRLLYIASIAAGRTGRAFIQTAIAAHTSPVPPKNAVDDGHIRNRILK